jgi:hypothetical protein
MPMTTTEPELFVGDDFELDLVVVRNEEDGDGDGCEQTEDCQTDDGCSSTCPSACNSSS